MYARQKINRKMVFRRLDVLGLSQRDLADCLEIPLFLFRLKLRWGFSFPEAFCILLFLRVDRKDVELYFRRLHE